MSSADPGQSLIADFCSQSNLLWSADHLDDWLDGRPRAGQIVTVTGAADVGRETWADVTDVAANREARR